VDGRPPQWRERSQRERGRSERDTTPGAIEGGAGGARRAQRAPTSSSAKRARGSWKPWSASSSATCSGSRRRRAWSRTASRSRASTRSSISSRVRGRSRSKALGVAHDRSPEGDLGHLPNGGIGPQAADVGLGHLGAVVEEAQDGRPRLRRQGPDVDEGGLERPDPRRVDPPRAGAPDAVPQREGAARAPDAQDEEERGALRSVGASRSSRRSSSRPRRPRARWPSVATPGAGPATRVSGRGARGGSPRRRA